MLYEVDIAQNRPIKPPGIKLTVATKAEIEIEMAM